MEISMDVSEELAEELLYLLVLVQNHCSEIELRYDL